MKILSIRQFNRKLKATVQQTGRLSFNEETVKSLFLADKFGIKFFMEGEPEELYMAIMEAQDEDSFPIRKSGAYFYVDTKLLFDELQVDYKAYTVFYDLVRCATYDDDAGGECYKMNKRTIKKKLKDDNIDEQ